jgi:hypothetical protein
VVIYAEGQATEPDYFRSLGREARQTVAVIIGVVGQTPLSLVKKCVEAKQSAIREKSLEPSDEYWVVFDRDQHLCIPQARALAAEKDIRIGYSDPCFELWLLWHFVDQTAELSRHEAPRKLKKHLANYEKSLDDVALEKLRSGRADALRRARQVEAVNRKHGEPLKCPASTVHHLVESIMRKQE